jgi:hypothetical protein
MTKSRERIIAGKRRSADTPPLALLFWTSTVVVILTGVLLPEVIGVLRPDYSSVINYISELGAVDAEYAPLINHFGFLPVAASSAIALLCLAKQGPATKWCNWATHFG